MLPHFQHRSDTRLPCTAERPSCGTSSPSMRASPSTVRSAPFWRWHPLATPLRTSATTGARRCFARAQWPCAQLLACLRIPAALYAGSHIVWCCGQRLGLNKRRAEHESSEHVFLCCLQPVRIAVAGAALGVGVPGRAAADAAAALVLRGGAHGCVGWMEMLGLHPSLLSHGGTHGAHDQVDGIDSGDLIA